MHNSSRQFQFINTSPYQERAFVLKSTSNLLQLHDDSTDIMSKSIIQKYLERPKKLENCTLADIVAMYNYQNSYKIRKKQRIIRYVCYNKHRDPQNYYREILLLHIPFRDSEENLLSNHTTWENKNKIHGIEKNKFLYTTIKTNLSSDLWQTFEDVAATLAQDNIDQNFANTTPKEDNENTIMVTNTTNIELYDINLEYTPYATNFQKQDFQLLQLQITQSHKCNYMNKLKI